MFNQGLFTALYIGSDGSVERLEMTEPFATLLDRNLLADLADERKAGQRPAPAPPTQTDQKKPKRRSRPSTAVTDSFVHLSKTDKPDGGAVRLGLHMISLVPPAGFEPALPPPEGGALSPELRGLSDPRTVQHRGPVRARGAYDRVRAAYGAAC